MKIIAVDDEEIALENLESAIHEAKPSAEVAAFDKAPPPLHMHRRISAKRLSLI